MAKSGLKEETIDSRKACCQETDRFGYRIIVNATDELLSSLNHACLLKIHTLFNDIGDLTRFTKRKMLDKQAKHMTKTTKDIETLREPREELSTCNLLSSTGDSVINVDARAPDKIKVETMKAIAMATHLATVLRQIRCENFAHVAKDFAHLRLFLRYAEDSMPECGCPLRSIGIGTQSDTVNGGFDSETSLDAPAEAYEQTRRADFIPEEMAKVSDPLAAEARLVCDVVTEETVPYARESVMLMAAESETEEETLEEKELLILPIIDAEEKLNDVAATDVATAAMRRESFSISETPQDFTVLRDETLEVPRSDATLDAEIPALSSAGEMKKDDDARAMSVEPVEKNDSSDTAITVVVTSEKKEEEREEGEESSSEIPLQPVMDKDIFLIDETTTDITVDPTVTDATEKPIVSMRSLIFYLASKE